MTSMDFVRQMAHSHNQAVYAIREFYEESINFDFLYEKAKAFVDEDTDQDVFKRELRKMYSARERNPVQ